MSLCANLIKELSNNSISEDDLIGSLEACIKSLGYHAPLKSKYFRANQTSFMTKELNKEVMTRSRLRNKFRPFRFEENKKAYNEQRNRYVTLLRNAKKSHFSNLDIKEVNDNKNFWKLVKPLFLKKVTANENTS